MDRAKERAANRGVGIRIAASTDGIDQGLFRARHTCRLPEGVLQSDENPALLIHEFFGRTMTGALEDLPHDGGAFGVRSGGT